MTFSPSDQHHHHHMN